MRLGTIRTAEGTRAVRVEGDELYALPYDDVGALLASPSWAGEARAGERLPVQDLSWAPVVPTPGKIVCVGLNYRTHILELGHELPTYPTLFAKYADTLTGPYDDIVLPAVSQMVDWEVELAVIVGASLRNASKEQAVEGIAGYTVCNDVSVRDWQRRTPEWLQGKIFEATTPLGPHLVTPDEVDGARDLRVRSVVDGKVMQEASTADLVFRPGDVVAYVSTILPLRPGDVVVTGTPGGVGHAQKPPVYLQDGQVLRTEIEGLGACVNRCVR
ncbi:MAG: fumarylacetoacetate hydrolase family protein [Carbonactinosporaceae bacterium]